MQARQSVAAHSSLAGAILAADNRGQATGCINLHCNEASDHIRRREGARTIKAIAAAAHGGRLQAVPWRAEGHFDDVRDPFHCFRSRIRGLWALRLDGCCPALPIRLCSRAAMPGT